jgi:catechol 2,3-dioxygenase-like lactoylglutathione lyase family enzyme
MFRNDHVAFQVRDMDRAIRFYTEKLGLRLLSRTVDENAGEEFSFLELEGGHLELLKNLHTEMAPPVEPQPPYCPHLALRTNSMSETLAMIKSRDIPVIKGPLEISGTVTWIYIEDPDRNIIEFVQWLQ